MLGIFRQRYYPPRPRYYSSTRSAPGGITVDLTGSILTADEQHVRTGGANAQIVLTVTGDTWVSGAAFDNARQAIIDGLDSDGVELLGWNNEVRDQLGVGAVVRTSSTVVTITLSGVSNYDITTPETITVQIPGTTALASSPEDDIFASPDFTIGLFELSCTLSGTVTENIDEDDIVAGGKTIILTLTGDDIYDEEPNWSFGPARQQILTNLVSDGSEEFGWDNEVIPNESFTNVVRTSDTVVTITLSASADYDITADEIITSTIPNIALKRSTQACDVTPTFTIATTEIPPPAEKKGGIGGKYFLQKGKPRRVMVDGVVHRVRSRAEERLLLGRFLKNQRALLETAEDQEKPRIRAYIKRAERRREKIVDDVTHEAVEHAKWLKKLQSEDEEILALMVLH